MVKLLFLIYDNRLLLEPIEYDVEKIFKQTVFHLFSDALFLLGCALSAIVLFHEISQQTDLA